MTQYTTAASTAESVSDSCSEFLHLLASKAFFFKNEIRNIFFLFTRSWLLSSLHILQFSLKPQTTILLTAGCECLPRNWSTSSIFSSVVVERYSRSAWHIFQDLWVDSALLLRYVAISFLFKDTMLCFWQVRLERNMERKTSASDCGLWEFNQRLLELLTLRNAEDKETKNALILTLHRSSTLY